MTELRDLLEDLRQGDRPPLSVDAVELLLGWLTGSAARDGGSKLPRPDHDPVLLHMVLHRLDDVLFDGGELRPAAAGLEPEQPAMRRRVRLRRLASAFHPDRFPDLADWLTQRSQAVHRAYARFKQDPDAPAATPAPRPDPHPQAWSGRTARPAAPRVRKQGLRAFANSLRARFGNDRYLAHKLIGGLAILALLPVLNMVLVPGNGTVDGFRVTVSGERQIEAWVGEALVGAGLAGDDRDPEGQSLARQAPTPVAGSAAGQGPESGIDASPDAGAGLAGDDRGPESRIAATATEPADPDAPARKPESEDRNPAPSTTEPEITPLLAAARRAMNPDGEIATFAALRTVDEQLAAMGLDNDTERLYRRIGEEAEKPVAGLQAPVSGEDPGEAALATGEDYAGAGSGRDRSAPEPPPAEPEAENQQPATRQPANQRTGEPSTDPGTGIVGDGRGPEGQSLARQAPTPLEGSAAGQGPESGTDASIDVGTGLAGDDRGREAQSPARQAPASVANPEATAPTQPATNYEQPTTNNQLRTTNNQLRTTNNQQPTTNPPTSQPVAGSLVLGPLGRHPAGEVLQRFHAALQAGNIAGVADSFAPDARMDSLHGRDQIADHFRSALNPADSREVNLKVLRLGREDGGWRVEADLDLRVDRSGGRKNLLAGRSSFLLAGSGDQLLITRMEIE